jgi:hypothetical protein
MELTPPGDERTRVLSLCVVTLQSGGAYRQNPAEWFWQAKSILSAAGADQPMIVEAYRSSSLAALRVIM